MFIKVCGLTKKEHIDWAIELGYSAIGFVLHEKSSRFCSIDKARELVKYANNKILTVAVGLKYEEVKPVYDIFDYIQVYEKVDIEKLIFAGTDYPEGIKFQYFLYDSSKGSGEFSQFPDWLSKISDRLIISGGLNIDNIKTVIGKYKSFGIDVSSGVEKKTGLKDFDLMKKFITEVKDAVK